MKLESYYPEIKKSVVAFVPKFVHPSDKETGYRFPPILGTGFVIRDDGLVATNRHVVDSFTEAWRPDDAAPGDWGIEAMFLYPAEKGIIDIRIPVTGVINLGAGNKSYAPKTPDLSIVSINAYDLVSISLPEKRKILEGVEVATSGYPLGRRALDGPSGIHQVTPTLQKGIISAVLPFPSEKPHSFSINIMSNPGGSGSPVFFADSGELAGILFSVLSDVGFTRGNDEYLIPTSISYAVPYHYIHEALSRIEHGRFVDKADVGSFRQTVCESTPGKTYRNGVCYHDFTDER